MSYKLEPFQEKAITSISNVLKIKDSVLAVSPGGSGKTVILSSVAYRFINNSTKDVLILVHSEALLHQTRKMIDAWYGIISQKIDASTSHIPSGCRIFVAMVETFDRRAGISSFISSFKNVGLLIVDEAHLSNFKKIFFHFPQVKRIGYTATPISAVKKDPLKNWYEDIIIVSKPSELIELNSVNPARGIVPVLTYTSPSIVRGDIKIKGNEFDEDDAGKKFSAAKPIQNTINQYIKRAYGKKTIIFNANVAHSILVTEAFKAAGFNCRHIDAKTDKKTLEAVFLWLKTTPDAILCNVGKTTTGFDEPSVEVIMLNSAMLSYTLYIQKSVRVSRPYLYPNGEYKKFGIIIDLGDNVIGGGHDLCTVDKDWEDLFWNPKKPVNGTPVIKSCPQCEGFMYASARICNNMNVNWFTNEEYECGYIFPTKEQSKDEEFRDLILVGGEVDIAKNIEYFADRQDYFIYNETIRQTVALYRNKIEGEWLENEQIEAIIEASISNATKFWKAKGKRKPNWLNKDTTDKAFKILIDLGFDIPLEQMELFQETESV